MLVQLLYFPGCPHVDAARRMLRQELGAMEHPPEIMELDVTDARTPAHLRSWGSPTILVNGVDIAGGTPSGPSCRFYPDSVVPGVPPRSLLEKALRSRSQNRA